MSLIEEALRRVKDPLLSSPPPTPTQQTTRPPAHSWRPDEPTMAKPTPESPLTPLVSPQTPTSLIAVGVAVLALAVVLLTVGVFWIGQTLRDGSTATVALEPAPEPLVVEEPAATEPPTPATTSPFPTSPQTASPAPLPRLNIQERASRILPSSPLALTPVPQPGLLRSLRKQKVPVLVLHGVVEGFGDPYAVINGSIVGIGERVEGLMLATITDGAVTLLSDDGQETVLRVSSR